MDSRSVANFAAITNDNPSLIRHDRRGRGSNFGAVRLLVVVHGGNLGAAESLHAAGVVVRCVLCMWCPNKFGQRLRELQLHSRNL